MKKRKLKVPTIKLTPEAMLGIAVGGVSTIGVNRVLESVDVIANNPQADAIIGGVQILAGVVLMTQVDNNIVKGVGAGMAGAGGIKLAESINLTTGNTADPMGDVAYLPNYTGKRGRQLRRKEAI